MSLREKIEAVTKRARLVAKDVPHGIAIRVEAIEQELRWILYELPAEPEAPGAEPVAEFAHTKFGVGFRVIGGWPELLDGERMPLYAHPPQPAVDGDAVELALAALAGGIVCGSAPIQPADRELMRAALEAAYPALQRQIAELTAERDAQSRAYGLILAERDAAVKRADEAERERQIVMDDWNAIEKRVETAEAERERLRKELQYIADANPLTWDVEVRDQFQEWAQNRARAAIAEQKAAQPQVGA